MTLPSPFLACHDVNETNLFLHTPRAKSKWRLKMAEINLRFSCPKILEMDKIFGALIVQRRIYFISKDLIFYPGFVLNKPQIYQIAGFIAGFIAGLF